MSIQITKTKAEIALIGHFDAIKDELPGASWVRQLRAKAIGAFDTYGLPHRRIEEWKYTDLRSALKDAYPPASAGATTVDGKAIDAALGALAALDTQRIVFINGAFSAELSTTDAGGDLLDVRPMASALAAAPDWLKTACDAIDGGADGDATLALNAAFMSDGAAIRINDDARCEKPILLIFARSGSQPQATTVRNLICVGANAHVALLEAYITLDHDAPAQTNTLTALQIAEGAQVHHIKFLSEGAATTHMANWLVQLSADANYRAFQLSGHTALARNQLFVKFNGEGATFDMAGAFVGRLREHCDTTLVVDHAVPRCTSHELFKTVLTDTARGVFQGKVIVRPDAQKSDGKQMAQALLLSETAEFDSKPELEIYADDVVCGHGSTSAELDEEQLFYLRARGVPDAQARALLTEAFIAEAIDQISDEDVRAALMDTTRIWLTTLTDRS